MILDYIDNIALSEPDEEKHFDSVQALNRLGEGISWAHDQVDRIERQARVEARQDNTNICIVGGLLEGKPMGLIACLFQWYAISACNYAQLVGWLDTRDAQAAKSYVRDVMPRLMNFRNKVAAHFAMTDPRADNEADLTASVMTQIIYVHGRLCAAALEPIIAKGSEEITVSTDISWSMTVAHHYLASRYWPNSVPQSTQSIRIGAGETVTFKVDWEKVFWHQPTD